MADIVMPRLSDSMEEGTILTWLKSVGDEVSVGEEIVEIETDKANMSYESDVAGTLTEILAEQGVTLPIGSPIARVADPGESSDRSAAEPGEEHAGEPLASSSTPTPHHPQPAKEETSGAPSTAALSSGASGGRIKASPVAKRMARENGLELSTIQGSGPGGRIVKSDVKKAVASAGVAAAGVFRGAERSERPGIVEEAAGAGPVDAGLGPQAEPLETAKGQTTYQDLSKLQATIARRMSESKATAPHFYLEAEIDMSRAVKARARIRAAASEGEMVPSFNDMVVKACALALREHPRANGAYRDGRFELYSRVNVGVAVAGQDALVVPTLFDADRKGLRQIASDSRALARRVREGTITPPELSGGTFTVSNLGMYGIDSFSAVINSPQAAILAVGAIKERPVIRRGKLEGAHMLSVTLACDHRILYGAPAAEFLAQVRALLEEPLSLAL